MKAMKSGEWTGRMSVFLGFVGYGARRAKLEQAKIGKNIAVFVTISVFPSFVVITFDATRWLLGG